MARYGQAFKDRAVARLLAPEMSSQASFWPTCRSWTHSSQDLARVAYEAVTDAALTESDSQARRQLPCGSCAGVPACNCQRWWVCHHSLKDHAHFVRSDVVDHRNGIGYRRQGPLAKSSSTACSIVA